MFERFTDHALDALTLAQAEARKLGHANVGTEDLLIAVMQLEDDLPARAMAKLGVPLETARKNVARMQIPTAARSSHDAPYTEATKTSLKLSLREALQLGHDYVGPEHLLLGIIRHDRQAVNAVLGVYPDTVRQVAVKLVQERDVTSRIETMPPDEPAVRTSAEISVEIEELEERLRVLKAERDAALKSETGSDPSWHH